MAGGYADQEFVEIIFLKKYIFKSIFPSERIKCLCAERAGTVNSYFSAFKDFPEAVSDWQDVIKIANGRWPGRESVDAKTAAEERFGKVYKRNSGQNHQNDDSAISIISYGLRPANRNMESEKAAIKTFRQVFKKAPEGAGDWDIVRAIAYSGAKR